MEFYSAAFIFLAVAQPCLGQSSSLCEAEGPRCDETCENLQYCPFKGAEPITVANCASNLTGNYCGMETDGTYQCKSDTCGNANAHAFKCIQQGVLPSPYQCEIYYICTELGGTPQLECTCDEGEIFSTITNKCAADEKCPDRPVVCETPGTGGVIDADYCYFCNEDNDAYIYRCSVGKWRPTRGPRAGKCGPYTGPPLPGGNGSTPTASPSEIPPTPTPTTPPSGNPSPSTTSPSLCEQSGQHLPNLEDCHSYFFCDSDLIPQPRSCPVKYIYDQIKKSCVLGEC